MKKFNVYIYEFNSKQFQSYDILPYLRNCIDERIKRYKNYKRTKGYKKDLESGDMDKYRMFPDTFEGFKKFIEGEMMYRFWSRTEYEIIFVDWPCGQTQQKIDIYNQYKMNEDIVCEILWYEYEKKRARL